MWKAIYVATKRAQADRLCEILTGEGFLVRVKPIAYGEDSAFEIQVPEAESEDAQTVVSGMGAEF